MDWMQSLRLVAPEIFLSVSGLVLLLGAAWGQGRKDARAINWLAVLVLVGAAAMTLPTLLGKVSGADALAFDSLFSADAFAAFAKVLIFLACAASLALAPTFFERHGGYRGEFPVLVIFAAIGMAMMVSSTNLLTLYVGLELNSLAAYVLAAFLKADERSAEAGLKYFVLGALASGFLLFGMSLTYGFTGTIAYSGIAAATETGLSTGALFGLTFMFAGLAFKVSAVPFHMWTPDVYEGAPTPVTTLFASAPKVAALALFARVAVEAFGSQSAAWQQIVLAAAIASIVFGALAAIWQTNIKRLLAYSSINNVGFILLGLAAASVEGVSAMLVYLAIYVPMTIGGFVAVLMLRDEGGNQLEAISDLAGLSRTRPLLALGLGSVMFSMAGIPFFFGFWGKFVVFQAAVQSGLLIWATIAAVSSVIGAFYYLKVVKVMYFDEPAGKVTGRSDMAHEWLLTISALFISPLGWLFTKGLGALAVIAAGVLFAAT